MRKVATRSAFAALGNKPALLVALVTHAFVSLSPRAAAADAREFRPVTSSPVVVPWLTLPVELELGNARHTWQEGPRATDDLAFLPGVNVDRWQFNLALRGLYQNPHYDFALGGRVGYRVADVLDGALPVRLAFDASYLTVHPGVRAAGGVQIGLGTLLSLGVWGGRDTSDDRTFVNLALELDTLKLGDPIGAILELTPTQDLRRD
jgi:hypothetical protein